MKLAQYYTASTGALIALLTYAVYSREQMYQIILFLVTSKVSYVILGNMLVATAFLISSILITLFLGKLSGSEKEMLSDRGKYAVTETCLALTIFRNELTAPIIVMFFALLFVKAFHWLARSRIDQLEQVVPVGYRVHFRLCSLVGLLAGFDFVLTRYCVSFVVESGKSVLILFAFEFGLQIIVIANMAIRYLLWHIDSTLSRGLESKGLYLMLSDLISDALKFITYLFFFSFVFVYYGMPIHILREMGHSFYILQKNARSFVKYVTLTRNLDSRFPSATADELEAAGDCLICREPMTAGKKLNCNHIFHLECLRMWLQHQQSCPLCRADIPVTASMPRAAAAAAGGGAGGEGLGRGGDNNAAPAAIGDNGNANAPQRVAAPVAGAAQPHHHQQQQQQQVHRHRDTVVRAERTIVVEELERIVVASAVAMDPQDGESPEQAALRASLVSFLDNSSLEFAQAEQAVRTLVTEGRISSELAEQSILMAMTARRERQALRNSRAHVSPVLAEAQDNNSPLLHSLGGDAAADGSNNSRSAPQTATAIAADARATPAPASPVRSPVAVVAALAASAEAEAEAEAVASSTRVNPPYQPHRHFDSPHDTEHTRRGTPGTSPNTAASPTAGVSTNPGSGVNNRDLPGFFVVQADIAAVHTQPNSSSGIIRTILAGTAVLVTERSGTVTGPFSPSDNNAINGVASPTATTADGTVLWHRIPDGWMRVDMEAAVPQLLRFVEDDPVALEVPSSPAVATGPATSSTAALSSSSSIAGINVRTSFDSMPSPVGSGTGLMSSSVSPLTQHSMIRGNNNNSSRSDSTTPLAAAGGARGGGLAVTTPLTGGSTSTYFRSPTAPGSRGRTPPSTGGTSISSTTSNRSRSSQQRKERIQSLQTKLDVMYEVMRSCQAEVDCLVLSDFEEEEEEKGEERDANEQQQRQTQGESGASPFAFSDSGRNNLSSSSSGNGGRLLDMTPLQTPRRGEASEEGQENDTAATALEEPITPRRSTETSEQARLRELRARRFSNNGGD